MIVFDGSCQIGCASSIAALPASSVERGGVECPNAGSVPYSNQKTESFCHRPGIAVSSAPEPEMLVAAPVIMPGADSVISNCSSGENAEAEKELSMAWTLQKYLPAGRCLRGQRRLRPALPGRGTRG